MIPTYRMENGAEVIIRPILPSDEPMMVRFHEKLSAHSVYLRYFHMMKLDSRVSHDRLQRICVVDDDHEMVLVAEHENQILAVGRLMKAPGANQAEFAIL